MRKRKAAVSHGIWTILPRWAAEFCKLACGIWQNFLQKTVGPTEHTHLCQVVWQTIPYGWWHSTALKWVSY